GIRTGSGAPGPRPNARSSGPGAARRARPGGRRDRIRRAWSRSSFEERILTEEGALGRGPLVLVWLRSLFLAVLALPVVGASAHDLSFTDTRLAIRADGTFRADLRCDLDALALGTDPKADGREGVAAIRSKSPAQRGVLVARLRRAASGPGRGETSLRYLRLGFRHIVPEGTDHILFVLGLFLLSPRLRPMLLQVSAFTLAHTATLALSTLGVVRLSPAVVEPLIALSIAYVAAENTLRQELRPWRAALVFGFGLLHGLGF